MTAEASSETTLPSICEPSRRTTVSARAVVDTASTAHDPNAAHTGLLRMDHMSTETPWSDGEDSPLRSRASIDGAPSADEALASACAEAALASPGRAIEAVLARLREAVGAERALLIEAAPPPRRARVLAAAAPAGAQAIAFSARVAARALRGDRPLFFRDVRRDEPWADGASVRDLALCGVLTAPVPPGDGPPAAIVLDSRTPIPLGRREADLLLRGFAPLVGILRRARPPSAVRDVRPTLVGRTPVFLRLMRDVQRAARVPFPVIVEGESGTGKELIARALHDASPRSAGPFVPINCAAIPESLLERELFGAVRGAFTGADRDHAGLLRRADGGTVFLDEIGDMPLALQAKLLRVLQEGTIRPVGALDETPVDVRVVSATHRRLSRLEAAGRFRADLRFRLQVLVLDVPALRDRLDDLPLLASRLLERLSARAGCPAPRIDSAALARLQSHRWPGNVRELESVLARGLLRAADGTIRDTDVDFGGDGDDRGPLSNDEAATLERAMIETALMACRGNLTAAARRIGWSRQTLYRRLRSLGLDRRARDGEPEQDQGSSACGGTSSSDSSTFQ